MQDDGKITQEVIDELIGILEGHVADGLKPEAPAEEAAESPEVEAAEGPEMGEPKPEGGEDDEDMKKLMEMYSRG